MSNGPYCFVGLDIHKHFLVACGVDREQNVIYGPHRVANKDLVDWIGKVLTPSDAVVLEMTTNTWEMVDRLRPHVHSVTVVHPPEVRLIVKAQVMTDSKASRILAKLHAAGLLSSIWIPEPEIRDLRALVAQRLKMVTLITQAKNRLHAVLHRRQIVPPQGMLFTPAMHEWWLSLPLSPLEQVRVECDLETLAFAEKQKAKLEQHLGKAALDDERTPLLAQLPGIGPIGAITLLAAIGDIERFPAPEKLVGYAGLGARVHASGESHSTGRITKMGRRDIRRVMVEAAHHAARSHPYWRAQYERQSPRLGRNKTLVAIARRLLVGVWHVLTKQVADRHAQATNVAQSLFRLAYRAGVKNLPKGMSAIAYTRQGLDRLGIGAELTHLPWGSKTFKLPPSQLA